MKLKIELMGVDGQAFLVDEETGTKYYKHDADQEIRPLADFPYAEDPMNLQGMIVARDEPYQTKEFTSFNDANKYISRIGLENEIKSIEDWEPNSENGKISKEKSLQLLKEELKKYE